MRTSIVASALVGAAFVQAQQVTSTVEKVGAATATLASPQFPNPPINGSIDGLPVPGVTGLLGNAAIVTNNPAGVTCTATLPNVNTTGIRGTVSGTSNANGTGVVFTINLTGFPSEPVFGPFLYHIHDQPVPANGSCNATLAHLDPYQRFESPPCDPTQPQTCQVGDLAGKHGNITGQAFQTSFLDLYASLVSGTGSYFGNRSIVIHSSNTTRLTCASFVCNGTSSSSSNVTSTGSPTSPTKPAYTAGAAATTAGSFGAIALGLLAYLL
ncbi:MAG: hypothetical protein M1827_006601 [Pycnora praestabilis]|nr:MAG: hypothetical protein M1827_006601 [Pycnora praestabilis]